MHCPRGCTTGLVEKERDKVTVDLCPECRGMWLNRGELERLVARARRDFEEDSRWSGRGEGCHEGWRERPEKKKRWFESLTDMLGD